MQQYKGKESVFGGAKPPGKGVWGSIKTPFCFYLAARQIEI